MKEWLELSKALERLERTDAIEPVAFKV